MTDSMVLFLWFLLILACIVGIFGVGFIIAGFRERRRAARARWPEGGK